LTAHKSKIIRKPAYPDFPVYPDQSVKVFQVFKVVFPAAFGADGAAALVAGTETDGLVDPEKGPRLLFAAACAGWEQIRQI